MKTLTLDYSKWRCGEDGQYRLGDGATLLLNNEGYSDILGQLIPQLSDVQPDILLEIGLPETHIPALTYKVGEKILMTDLCLELADINDGLLTTTAEKIERIKTALNSQGYQLEVINKPH